MPFVARPVREWKLKTRSLALGERTLIMGILNVTPDSFSDGGRFRNPEDAIAAALSMLEAGATIVDVGGESTRPGDYEKISSQEEVNRVLPVIRGILEARPGSVLSVDTYRAPTARAAIEAGAEIVNDVSGFLWDPNMPATCAALQCGVVLMHTRGRPEEWKKLDPLPLDLVVPLVLDGLKDRLAVATKSGIAAQQLVIDPGFGFGKRLDENYPLLAHLDELLVLGYPVLAGVSRKGFLGNTLAALLNGVPAPVDQRGNGNLAAQTVAVLNGASVLRVHDVEASAEAAAIADAVLAAR